MKQGLARMQAKAGVEQQMPPAAIPNRANPAPQGGTVIGTSGGKKVYKLPDGTHVMEQ